MTTDFQKALSFVLQREGGFVDDPADPGGATNMGITLNTLSAWRGVECSVEDVENLQYDEAAQIYQARYWNPIAGDFLPWPLNIGTFDAAVNSGVHQGVRWLQAAIGVVQDGTVGQQTILAAKQSSIGSAFNDMLNVRLAFLKSLPSWSRFGTGWGERIELLREMA